MAQEEIGRLTGETLGGYQLLRLLGAGGMAEVYRAADPALEREVAVKVLPRTLADDPGYVTRFRDEARHVAALNHPNIVPIYGFGEERGLLYLVMPLVPSSLRERLDRERKLPPQEAAQIALQLASALEAAHALGIVHRDVKPENVLLDTAGAALLTDFGIAREVTALRQQGAARTLAATGLPVGTPEYMAPEQLRGESLDQRADEYALGAVLYEMLTGRVPHEADTPYHVAMLAATEPVKPPSEINVEIWPALERVTLTALAREADARYSDMGSFAAALREAMTDAAMAEDRTVPIFPIAAGSFASGAAPYGRASRQLAREKMTPRRMVGIGLAVGAAILLIAGLGSALVLSQGNGTSSGNGVPLAKTTATATATVTPLPTATPEPTATATQVPLPPLSISPMPLVLAPSSQNPQVCSGVQTIRNTTGQTLGWAWQKPSQRGFFFQIDGTNVSGWPSDMSPGIAPGGQDTLVATTGCKAQAQSFPILVQDSQGRQYTFVMQVQAGQGGGN